MWWFYVFKLYLMVNDQGGIISTANVDDRKPISEMVDELWACLHGDEGYLSDPLERELVDKGVTLITGMKKT